MRAGLSRKKKVTNSCVSGHPLSKGYTEEGSDGQDRYRNPGFVDGLNQRRLFHERTQDCPGRCIKRAALPRHKDIERYADKFGRGEIASLQFVHDCNTMHL